MTEINEIVLYVVIFLIGGILGFVLCRMTSGKKQAAAQQQELEDSKAELEQYKSQVNEHFTNSAELMEQVASSYQALYSHMAGQSQTLLGDTDMLPFAQLQTLSDKEQEVAKEAEEVLQTDAAQESEQDVPKHDEPETESSVEKTEIDDQAAEQQTAESSEEKAEPEQQTAESSEQKTEPEQQTAESTAKETEPADEAPSKTAQK